MYKVPCNNPFILFSPDSWSKPAQLFKSQLLATAYTSPWGYASVILLWSCMSNGINSHKKCVRRQPKVSNPAAVLNFWNSELSSFSIALLKFSLMLQSIQSWSLGKFAFLYIFSVMLSLGLFTCSLCRRIFFSPSFKFQVHFIHSGISTRGEFTFFFPWEYTTWNADNTSWRFTSQIQTDLGSCVRVCARVCVWVCACVHLCVWMCLRIFYEREERRNNDIIIIIL